MTSEHTQTAYFLKWSNLQIKIYCGISGPCHVLRSRVDINLKLSLVSPVEYRIWLRMSFLNSYWSQQKCFLVCKICMGHVTKVMTLFFVKECLWYEFQLRNMCGTRGSRRAYTPISCSGYNENEAAWRINLFMTEAVIIQKPVHWFSVW